MTTFTQQIVWVSKTEATPDFNEMTFKGTFAEALTYAKALASDAKFMMAQVLAFDGKVLATVCSPTAIKLAE